LWKFAAVMFQPKYEPSGASRSTTGTPPSSLPSASTRGTSILITRLIGGGKLVGTPEASLGSKCGPQS